MTSSELSMLCSHCHNQLAEGRPGPYCSVACEAEAVRARAIDKHNAERAIFLTPVKHPPWEERARRALLRYAMHESECETDELEEGCTCGMTAALDDLGIR